MMSESEEMVVQSERNIAKADAVGEGQLSYTADNKRAIGTRLVHC